MLGQYRSCILRGVPFSSKFEILENVERDSKRSTLKKKADFEARRGTLKNHLPLDVR